MNFIQAFDKVNKPAAAAAPAQFMQANISQDNKSFMNDDMKSYIDAKFEALKTDLISEMSSNKGTNNTVETPQETSGQDAIIRPEEEKPGVDSTIENK